MPLTISLYVAAFLAVAVGVAHSYLGERHILIRLFRRPDLPKLSGSAEVTARTLRFAWHVTSIAWFGFAGILLLLAHPPLSHQHVGWVVGATLLATAAAVLVGSRGKHPAWVLFAIIGVIALYASQR